MNSKSAFASVLLAATVGLTFMAQPASASIGAETASQTVKFRDLDLNQPEDAKALLRRIRRAATMVCTGSPTLDAHTYSSRTARNCIKQASGEAVTKVDHPVVTAMYDGGPLPVQLARK
jgi:UrcA family protein